MLEHLMELRRRLIGAVIAVVIGMLLSFFLVEPWAFRYALAPMGGRQLIYLGLAEAFSAHLTLAFYLGCVLATPIIAWQFWAFVAPGLYPTERRLARRLAFVSTLLFLIGAAFSYFIVLPVMVEFFLSYELDGLRYGGAVAPWLNLLAGTMLTGGLAFQLPLALLALISAGLVTRESLATHRRHWILGIVVVAAVLTPTGDAATLALFAVPLWLLFELTLILAPAASRRPAASLEQGAPRS